MKVNDILSNVLGKLLDVPNIKSNDWEKYELRSTEHFFLSVIKREYKNSDKEKLNVLFAFAHYDKIFKNSQLNKINSAKYWLKYIESYEISINNMLVSYSLRETKHSVVSYLYYAEGNYSRAIEELFHSFECLDQLYNLNYSNATFLKLEQTLNLFRVQYRQLDWPSVFNTADLILNYLFLDKTNSHFRNNLFNEANDNEKRIKIIHHYCNHILSKFIGHFNKSYFLNIYLFQKSIVDNAYLTEHSNIFFALKAIFYYERGAVELLCKLVEENYLFDYSIPYSIRIMMIQRFREILLKTNFQVNLLDKLLEDYCIRTNIPQSLLSFLKT